MADRYRLILCGEDIELDDEFLADDCEHWLPLNGWEVGMKFTPNFFVPMRRKLDIDAMPAKEGA